MSSKSQAAARSVGVHYDGDLRAELLAAAARSVAAHGHAGISLRAVAREVGVSHAAPAHHFGDRTGLLTALATEGFVRFTDHVASGVLGAGSSPVEVLQAMGRAYADFAVAQAGYFDVMFDPSLVDADDAEYLAASDAAFDALLGVVADCQAKGFRPDQERRSLAVALWAFAHGLAVLRRRGSLERHHADASLDAVEAIAAALLPD